MAIPNNYIDKITKEGDSRMICPAADKVRVENQNFESGDLDGALNELAGGKANKDETYTKEEVNEKVPLRIPATKNGDVITSTTDYGEIANAVKEDWRDAYVVVNNEAIFSFYQVEQNAIIFTRVDAEDGTQAYLAVSSNNVWSIEYSAISGGGEGTVTGVKVGETTYPPNTEGVVDISAPISNKVDNVPGKVLSTNDYTDAEKTKLAGLPTNPVTSISVNGQTPQTPNNGNVNIVVQAGAQGQKGDKGDTVVLDPQGLPQFSIVNDLVYGGEANALSAEMGRRLAMLSGTFDEAWAHAQAIPYVFPWLWVETVDGDAICKPIWHRGSSNFVDATGSPISIEATAVPAAPTIALSVQPTNNEVPKNTIATITPASGSALYYSVDGGTTYNVNDRAVSIPLNTAGQITIQAYCLNNRGQSTTTSLTVSVAGVSVPTFSEANNAVISRGGYVTITGDKDGTLSYSVNGVAQTPVVGDGVNAPTAQVQITGATTIVAHNTVDGDDSIDVSASYTIVALAAPTLSDPSIELPSIGGTVTITAPTGATGIKYTDDGSDPKTSGTATTINNTTATVNVTVDGTTIRAIGIDGFGEPVTESSATYTLAYAGITVNVSEPIDMLVTLTSGGTTQTINLVAGENKIPFSTIGGTEIYSIKFGDSSNSSKTKVIEINFGGCTVKSQLAEFFRSCSSLKKCVGLVIGGADTNNMFNGCSKLETVQLSGLSSNCNNMFYSSGNNNNRYSLDLSDFALRPEMNVRTSTMFGYANISGTIDIRKIDTTLTTQSYGMFAGCKATKIIIGNLVGSGFTTNAFTDTLIRTVRCTTAVPPAVGSASSANWLAQLSGVAGNDLVIEVPAANLADYEAAEVWRDYSQYMTTY